MRNSTRLLIHSLLCSSAFLALVNCSGSENASFDNMRDASTGGSSATGGSGGSSGRGGASGSGGNAGGATGGSSGASGKGGAGGSAGSAGTGGATGGTGGSGGATGGTGGTGGATGGTGGVTGGTGGTGGVTGGTGGTAGAGAGGTAGTAGTGGTAGKGGGAGKDGGAGKGGNAGTGGTAGTGGNSGASGSAGKAGAAGSNVDAGPDADGGSVDVTSDGASDAHVDASCPTIFGTYQINNADGTLCGNLDEDADQEIRGTAQACFLNFISVAQDGGGSAISGGTTLAADGTFSGATLTLGTTPRMPCNGTWNEQAQELTVVCGTMSDTCTIELVRLGP